jgi:heptosyltransferase-2
MPILIPGKRIGGLNLILTSFSGGNTMEFMKIVVRAPNWIGDSVLALPALNNLKKNFPDSQIWISARDWVKDLFTIGNLFEGILPLQKQGGMKALRESSREFKNLHFDLGILFTNSFASALLFYLARIPERWGYKKDGRGFLLTKGIPVQRKEDRPHQVHYYLDLLYRSGLKKHSEDLEFPLDQKEKVRTGEWLKSMGIDPENMVIIINPGAYYGSAKRWPPGKYAELAALLQKQISAQVLIIGSPDDLSLAEDISSRMEKKPFVLAGQISLSRLASVISFSNLFVTNDSGPMHLANALKVPVVALFGPTDPNHTGPYQQPSSFIHKGAPCWPCFYRDCPFDHRCMRDISPQEVLLLCQKYLP